MNNTEKMYEVFLANKAFTDLENAFEKVSHNVFDKRFKLYANKLIEVGKDFDYDRHMAVKYGFITLEEGVKINRIAKQFIKNTIHEYHELYKEEIGENEYDVQWLINYGHSREEAMQIVSEWDKDE